MWVRCCMRERCHFLSRDVKRTDWRDIPVAVVMTWFHGTSRGCCCYILLVLFLYFLPPWSFSILEIMLIVFANLWKERRWQNTSQSRATGASNGVYINFSLWKSVSLASFKQNCQANIYRGLTLLEAGPGDGKLLLMFKDFGRDWKGAPLTDSSARINQSINQGRPARHGTARRGMADSGELQLSCLDVLQQSHQTARMKEDVTNVKDGGAASAAICAYKPWWCLSRLHPLPWQQRERRRRKRC